ncbi:lipopolysaccharide biosynthesis protein [Sphingomonas sp. DT-207]|uniref:lipopolysaccharide biosynthesis protein n=1 Tax=Sphingomonas sp. DT-207 TaxID=3396167 RepID=UPI003F1C911F
MHEILAGGLRLAGLSMRMFLALFMAKYLSLEDLGIFSLLVGLSGLLPGAAGLGLSYFVNREIVSMASQPAVLLARDRLIVTVACGAASCAGLALLVELGQIDIPVRPWMCALVIVLEMVGFDLHLLLIARHRAPMANFLLFMRSAFWIPIFMTCAYLFPAYRDINALIGTWLFGLVIYLLITVIVLRRAVLTSSLWTSEFNIGWLRSTLPRAMPIWISDFALAISQNADRFIISSVIGVAAAGIYYFYFSIANAAFLIVQSATTQPYMPRLRRAFTEHAYAPFVRMADRCLAKLAGFAFITFVMTELATLVLVNELERAELARELSIMPILLVGMMGKATNDYFGIIDYIMEQDKRFIALNIVSFVLVIMAIFILTPFFHIQGAAVGMATIMIILALARGANWEKNIKPKLLTETQSGTIA